MKFKKLNVSGLEIFYRESGSPDKPVMILFHGFPSASHMFRDLIPMLEDKFHVIAPDYPGFGQSSMPSRKDFNYSFDNIADVMNEFIKALGLEKFFMYVFD